jgi:hypothetical protein
MGRIITANPERRPLTPVLGKTVVGRCYLHVGALSGLDDVTQTRVGEAGAIVGLFRGSGDCTLEDLLAHSLAPQVVEKAADRVVF